MSAFFTADLVREWGVFLLGINAKAALLVALLFLADRLLGEKKPVWQNLVWVAAVMGLLLIPLTSALLPGWQVPISWDGPTAVAPQALYEEAQTVVGTRESVHAPRESSGVPVPSVAAVAAGDVGETVPGWGWPLAIYGVGVCYFLGRVLVGAFQVVVLRRRARDIEDADQLENLRELKERLGISRHVQLATYGPLTVPMQLGVFSPVVLLPAWLRDDEDDASVRVVIAHELAHISRWDLPLGLLAACASAFYWCNPLAWLAVRRLRQTSERACDDWAVRLSGQYEVYAQTLIQVLRSVRERSAPLRVAMASAADSTDRVQRVLAMKNEVHPPMIPWTGGLVMATLVICMVVLGCSTFNSLEYEHLPGGGKIAYYAGGVDALMLVNADGTNRETPAHLQLGVGPVWSADGRRIAYTAKNTPSERNPYPGYDIWIMDADGNNRLNLTEGRFTYSGPSISADGERVAFHRMGPGSDKYEIYVVEADGTGLRNVSNSRESRDENPAISPDGRWVAFSSNRVDDMEEIYVVELATMGVRRLTYQEGYSGMPSWSPDGTQIAWWHGSNVWVMNWDGTGQRQVTDADGSIMFHNPAWSPDGTKIAMQSLSPSKEGQPNDIWVIDADGSNLRQLTDRKEPDVKPSWMPVSLR